MRRCPVPLLCVPLLCLITAGCSDEAAREQAARAALIAQDPVIARALHDPLMSDPDLASRNEANAAIGFVDSHALPVITASSAEASAAREALRLELLADGPIPNLPRPTGSAADKPFPSIPGPMASVQDLLAAVGADPACAARLEESFALAANLPAPATLPPRAMVMQAGSADSADCAVRIIRYTSAAVPEDLLQYHYAKAVRAGMTATHHADPAAKIIAQGMGAGTLVVQVRKAAHGLTGVDLIYRAP